MIDLHMHSTFSDGSFTPEELVAAAKALGLRAMALTDHDTFAGLARFEAAAREAGIRTVSGVEISAETTGGPVHLLAYGFDPAHAGLAQALAWIREGRETRNRALLEKLHTLGLKITMEEVQAHAGLDIVARPHFALALVARSFARDKRDAFERYLGRDRAAYVERARHGAAEIIDLIRQAGGVPVLAHPFSHRFAAEQLRRVVREMAGQGLMGIEAYYPEHTEGQQQQALQWARDLGLLATGGTDFHGKMTPGIVLGRGHGNLRVPDEAFVALAEAMRALRAG